MSDAPAVECGMECAGCTAECAACATMSCGSCDGCNHGRDMNRRGRAAVANLALLQIGISGQFAFNPNQRRGPDGRFIKMGGPGSASGSVPGRKSDGSDGDSEVAPPPKPRKRAAPRKTAAAKKAAPQPAPTPPSTTSFDDRAANAAAGPAALKAAPISTDAALSKLGDGITIRNALGDYRDNGYMHVNWALRKTGGSGDLPDRVDASERVQFIPGHYTKSRADKMVSGLDALMRASKLKQDVVVSRGIANPATTFGTAWLSDGDNSGLEWIDPSYASTTVAPKVARKFASNGAGVVMRILAPKGTGAAGVKQRAGSRLANEKELLLDRGLRYRIVRDYTDDGVRTVDVEVVP